VKLIEEIKKAEEKAETMKKDAEKQGQELLDAEYEKNKQAIADLESEKEDLLKEKLSEAAQVTKKESENLKKRHEQEIRRIEEHFKKNNEKAIQKVQNIILQWPSSQ
jgi:V/A-type H+-transporting ATPase subunit G/H